MLGSQRHAIEGLRPYEEIKAKLLDAIKISRKNPGRKYEIVSTLGKGATSRVMLAMRRDDE